MTREILKDALETRAYEYEQLLINMEDERSDSIDNLAHAEEILDQTMNITIVKNIMTELEYLENILLGLAEA